MKQEDFNEEFRTRTKRLALEIIKMIAPLPYSDALSVVRRQLVKACTSMAANFRSSCRTRSNNELYSKLCIVVEETDETVFWLEFMVDGEFLTMPIVAPKIAEAIEILKVMASFKKKNWNLPMIIFRHQIPPSEGWT